LVVPDINAVLLDVLSILHSHSGGRLPSLVERYLAQRRDFADPITRFRECVDDLIKYRGIGNSVVQRAVAIVERRFTDCRLTQAAVAEELGVMPQDLSMLFKQHTGVTFTEYLRNMRLDRAAELLAATQRRIKEIWVEVGYNDASNFDHQFRERFRTTPRGYRALWISPMREASAALQPRANPRAADELATDHASVLIVDDNDGTRETIAQYLRLSGYRVAVAACGQDGLVEARQAAPRVVVLDYNLPDMDGLDWLRSFRSQTVGVNPSVLLFTADWEVVERSEEIRSLGATFVSKLCDIEELERLIASPCGRT